MIRRLNKSTFIFIMAVIFTFAITVAQSSVADYKGVASSSISETEQITEDDILPEVDSLADDETADDISSDDESSEDSSSDDSSSEDSESSEDSSSDDSSSEDSESSEDSSLDDSSSQDESSSEEKTSSEDASSTVKLEQLPVMQTLGDVATAYSVRAADTPIGTVQPVGFPRKSPIADPNLNILGGSTRKWGNPSLNMMNGWYLEGVNILEVFTLAQYGGNDFNGKVFHCIEPGVPIYYGNILTTENKESNGVAYWNNLSAQSQSEGAKLTGEQLMTTIGRILRYGYTGNVSSTWLSTDYFGQGALSNILATRILIWEAVVGQRNIDFSYINPSSGKNHVKDSYTQAYLWDTQTYNPQGMRIQDYYNSIVNSVQDHSKIPSFSSYTSNSSTPTYKLNYDFSSNKWTTTLTDGKAVLSKFDFTAQGMTFTKNENNLVISSVQPPSSTITVTANDNTGKQRQATLVRTDGIVNKSPANQLQDMVTYDGLKSDPVTNYFKLSAEYGSAKLSKVDAKTNNPLPGAEFTVYKDGKATDFKGTTDTDGVLTINYLPLGTYTIKETKAPTNYLLDETEYTFSISNGQVTNINNGTSIPNTPLGSVSLSKVDAGINDEDPQKGTALSGAEFTVYKDAGDGAPGEEVSKMKERENQKGIYELKDLPVGNYLVKETKAPTIEINEEKVPTHILPEEDVYYPFSITSAGQNVEIDGDSSSADVVDPIPNSPILGSMKLTKVDASDYSIKLSGAEFTVYADTDGNGAYTEGTDATVGTMQEGSDDYEGVYTISNLRIGIYHVVETSAPTGYVRELGARTVHIKDDTEQIIGTVIDGENPVVTNAKVYGSVELTKVSSENAQEYLSGAEFTVYTDIDEDGKLDREGENDETKTFNGFMTYDTINKYKMENIPTGKYLVVETKAPEGYLPRDPDSPTDKVYPFEIPSSSEGGEILIQIDGDPSTPTKIDPITNTPVGSVSLSKVDAGINDKDPQKGTALSGAEFTVYAHNDENENGTYEEGECGDVVSTLSHKEGIMTDNGDGSYKLENLLYGNYLVKETGVPTVEINEESVATHILGTTYYPFSITEAGQAVAIDGDSDSTNGVNPIPNTPVKGSVQLTKVAADGLEAGENLSGAVFTVYADSNGDGTLDADESNAEPVGTMQEGEGDNAGVYTLGDLRVGTYFVKETEAPEGYLLDAQAYKFTIRQGETAEIITNNEDETFENKAKNWAIKIVKKDALNGNYITVAGATFQIFAPNDENNENPIELDGKTEFVTDETGTIITEDTLAYGKGYKLIETKAPYGYVLDSTSVVFDVTDEETNTNFQSGLILVEKIDARQKGKIQITKKGEVAKVAGNAENGYQITYEDEGLAGVKFDVIAAENILSPDGSGTIIYESGYTVETITTGADGIATTGELPLGKYTVQEVEAPVGYMVIEDSIDANIEYNATDGGADEAETVELPVENTRRKFKINFSKMLEEDERGLVEADLTQVKFGLYTNGELTVGETTLKADTLLEEITVSEDGTAQCQSDLPAGSYYLKEIATQEEYILSEAKYEFMLSYEETEAEMIEVTVDDREEDADTAITNKLIKGSVSLQKVDAGINEEDSQKGTALSGAEFTVYKDAETIGEYDENKDTVVEVMTDNKDGSYKLENLPYGNYLVKETKAPTVGIDINGDGDTDEPDEQIATHILDETVYPFSITGEGTVEIDGDSSSAGVVDPIENEPIKGAVQLTKIDSKMKDSEGNPVALSGAEFTVYDKNNKEAGKMSEEEGVYILRDLRVGKYYVKETKTPTVEINGEAIEIYVLDKTKYWFNITNNKTNEEIDYNSSTEEIDPIPNVPKFGSAKLTKVDEDFIEQKITGSTFVIYVDENKNGIFEQSIDSKLKTMEDKNDGEYIADNLRFGYYLLHETVAPDGYVSDEGYYPFTIQSEEVTVIGNNRKGFEDKFLEKPGRGSVELVKVDAEFTDDLVSGSIFTVYKDENENGTYDSGEAEIGTMIDNAGVYSMSGLRYGYYLVKETKAPEGYLVDPGYYSFEIKENGETVTVDNKSSGIEGAIDGKFLEEPIRGIFKLIKTDMSDGSLLEGVGFRVKNSEGEVVYEGYTNQYGELETPLRCGKYTYQEFKALDGYTIDETEYPFEIKENDEIVKAEMQNNKNPDNPQVKTKGTGQNNEMVYVFILISVVCLFAISMIIKNRRKK